ncbi:MAG TPA: peptide chain release factor N(5)-glutamine methyltransferase [Opitutaceae bacterium]
MITLLDVIQKSADFLGGKGVEGARLNAEHLVGHALGLKRMQLYLQFERVLTEPELEKIRPLVRRRSQREPLQYIIGETEFDGLKLKVDRRALIPRPETEYLVELIVARLATPPASILDLGTGTGALALALAARYPEAAVTAVDSSAEALALAAENALATGLASRVTLLQSDWFQALSAKQKFDLIVSNPPYLTADETAETAPEVRDFEPHSALTARDEGLSDLRVILAAAPAWLNAGGALALETGIAQHAALQAIAAEAGWATVESIKDLTGRDRYLWLRRPA